MRSYIKARKHARRARLIEMLGGKCVRCGSTENLHLDHIDPATKRFAVGSDMSRAWELLVEEALKCQLLCPPCHVEKDEKTALSRLMGSTVTGAGGAGVLCVEQVTQPRVQSNGRGKQGVTRDRPPSRPTRDCKPQVELPRCDSNTQPAG